MSILRLPIIKLVRICILAVITVLLVQVALFSLQWRMMLDQPLMFYLGYLMDRFGAVPYRDFFEMNPPGTHLVYAWIGRLTGFDEFLIRWTDLLLLALLFRITASWMRPLGRAAGWLALVYFGFNYFSVGPAMSLEREFLLLLPLSLAVLVVTEGGRLGPALRALAAGACFGCAASLKPHIAIGMLPIALYLVKADRRERNPAGPLWTPRAILIFAAAGVGFVIPLALIAVWLHATGALRPFWEMVRNYWPVYQDITYTMEILPPEQRTAYVFEYLRGLDGKSPYLIMPFVGAYAGLAHTEAGTERRDRISLIVQLALCGLIYAWLGGKFWPYHYLPLFFFSAMLGGLCFMNLPAESTPLKGWFLVFTVLMGLCLSVMLPKEYLLQLKGFQPGPPARAEFIANYLKTNMKPGDKVQPLDVTGGAVHGMFLARAPLATPFIYDFHFYHHIYNDYTRVLRQRFMDAILLARPRFIIQVEWEKPWIRGEDTTMTFGELQSLISTDYVPDYEGQGMIIHKRKTVAGEDAPTTYPSHVTVQMPQRPKPLISASKHSSLFVQEE